jgi:hypothetical protein
VEEKRFVRSKQKYFQWRRGRPLTSRRIAFEGEDVAKIDLILMSIGSTNNDIMKGFHANTFWVTGWKTELALEYSEEDS